MIIYIDIGYKITESPRRNLVTVYKNPATGKQIEEKTSICFNIFYCSNLFLDAMI